ncbi:MAG: cytochrome c maturation protein CcmE [Rhodospirillales bacterium]|nr:cytochrome c maturation protein CcmE [Rhodospirillales bacterium]MDH3966272.1 cytochrome c maturation protein CcmE [Rhodospirillales bacterium]
MKPKKRRLVIILAGLSLFGLATGLVLAAFDEGVTYFYSPTDLVEKQVPQGRMLRIGGLVEEESLVRGEGLTVTFRVTDLAESVPVQYSGILPDLFREGQGVVAVGKLEQDGVFVASEVLAKHDENYMPPEAAEALKKAGQWTEGDGQ